MITSMLNSLDIYRYIWIHYLLTIRETFKGNNLCNLFN
eukprot:UN09201